MSDLRAKRSRWGDVRWTGYYARGYDEITGAVPARKNHPAMTYVMVHADSTSREYRTVDDLKVTNLYCGVGKGWDVLVCGTVMGHFDRKTEAQGAAESLLDG